MHGAAAELLPGFLDRHEVPHMFVVAPRAQIKNLRPALWDVQRLVQGVVMGGLARRLLVRPRL
jgi:hypothetical protein